MLVPESRKRPITEALLYKQIIRFFREENTESNFDIVFISITSGIIEARGNDTLDYDNSAIKLPPKIFPSGRSWVSKAQISQMADNIIEYLKTYSLGLTAAPKVLTYVRGSYLEAVRLASKRSDIEIEEIFTENELVELKRKGIRWMKIGLRMDEAFSIFQRRIKEFMKEKENRQLLLF